MIMRGTRTPKDLYDMPMMAKWLLWCMEVGRMGWMDEWMDGQDGRDGWMSGWMGRMDGMDGWVDGWRGKEGGREPGREGGREGAGESVMTASVEKRKKSIKEIEKKKKLWSLHLENHKPHQGKWNE
ncbi:hypothetical protein BC829DRAFT_422918 [Chytridium lagenaria]|nr:hypothetical protein BC829DRAFT_422918 [Chytridium lagenaria]